MQGSGGVWKKSVCALRKPVSPGTMLLALPAWALLLCGMLLLIRFKRKSKALSIYRKRYLLFQSFSKGLDGRKPIPYHKSPGFVRLCMQVRRKVMFPILKKRVLNPTVTYMEILAPREDEP